MWSNASHRSWMTWPDQCAAVMPVFHCSWQPQDNASHEVAQRSDDAAELASGVYSPSADESGPCELRVRKADDVRPICTRTSWLCLLCVSAPPAAQESDSTPGPGGCDSERTAGVALQCQDLRSICCRLICRYESACAARVARLPACTCGALLSVRLTNLCNPETLKTSTILRVVPRRL